MSDIEVSEYKPEDMLAMGDIVNQPGMREAPGFDRWAETRGKYGPAMTFKIDGEVLACAGVNILWPGVGEVWLSLSKKAALRYKMTVIRVAGQILDMLQGANKLWRIQADVMNTTAAKFLEHYGFHMEGLMLHYSPAGTHMLRYARIRPEFLHATR